MQTQVEERPVRAAPQILRAILENKVTRASLERESGGTAKTGHHLRMEIEMVGTRECKLSDTTSGRGSPRRYVVQFPSGRGVTALQRKAQMRLTPSPIRPIL